MLNINQSFIVLVNLSIQTLLHKISHIKHLNIYTLLKMNLHVVNIEIGD